ncbi:uncharacterized protein K452DRAFT_267630 [Aplosporella prunicola CBS 121167]|uniref:N-acetyltransferase domain-containing protein n=1 Tax=Aplosporella prunicola CBS 121167 TaxID=1176127 RepID=A0A6A6BJK4_9PEZI|nr:uncharacterized protein K452DRAFT_267630 [Aplosporella prunicola CBS 121167]KAF2144329.1 hypothetical protein K452DRAFT_267630 [Aplosporella prunicola CBS 121167]
MPLKVLPIGPSDIDDFVRLHYEAFRPWPAIGSCIWARDLGPESRSIHANRFRQALEDKETRMMKVVDTETGETIAAAKWAFYDHERTQEELEKSLVVPEPVPDANPEALKAMMGMLYSARREVMGTRPYYLLHLLVTDRKHYRRGAAGMLLQWGMECADAAGLECYLEGSEMGRPLYERNGFVPIKDLPFDMSKYGGKGVNTHTCMIRQPRTPGSSA